jgi:predicted DNA-binding protein YlxM (UPF0122 family)
MDKTTKRTITEKQEEALRLCHHDFEGLTEIEAAARMGISQQAISKLLNKVKEIAPQFFPILTKLQAECYHHSTCDGWSPLEIAKYMYRSKWSVYKALQACGKKGLPLPDAHGDIMKYTENMDDKVIHKF